MTARFTSLSRKLITLATTVVFVAVCAATSLAQYAAQPVASSPSQFGGTTIESVPPFQPSTLFELPADQSGPTLLDESIVFEQPVQPVQGTTEIVQPGEAPSQLPPGTRAGIFQKMFIRGAWLPRTDDDSLGISTLKAGAVFGFPMTRRETPLLVTPQFRALALDGPSTPDLPATLYDAEIEFRHLRKFGDGPWAMDAAVTVGYYSDFEQSYSDAVRVSGRGIAVYESQPGTKWLLGAAYVNRAGLRVFPVVGLIHEAPDSDMRWDLLFPRPRVSWRLSSSWDCMDEKWVYLGGEFGGGIWSVENPATLLEDELTYRDVRILVGYERKIVGGLSRRFEVGYVFGRELEYASSPGEVGLDDSLFLRAGLTF